MEEDHRTIAERTLGIELTAKANEHLNIAFIRKAAADQQLPKKARNNARKLLDGLSKLQRLTPSSPNEQQAMTKRRSQLLQRIAKFRSEIE